MNKLKNQLGMSMVEVTLSMAMIGAGALAIANLGGNSSTQINTLEFRLLKEQYKMQTMNQFLTRPNNCKCLMKSMEIPKTFSSRIVDAGDLPWKELGMFNSNCSAMVNPYLKETNGPDGVKLRSLKLMDVDLINNTYYGSLAVLIETKKKVNGKNYGGFKIPVTLKTSPSSNPSNVIVDGCSTSSSGLSESPFRTPPQGSNWSIPLNPASGNFEFKDLPPTASGVFIQYTIGAPRSSSNKREDRNCDITGTGVALKIGTDSKGDGGQHYVAGSAFVPLDGCSTPMRYSCVNKNNLGQFRVMAYIDDGNAPECGGKKVTCTPPQVFDGVSGCVTPGPEGFDCPAGTVYSEAKDACEALSVTCTPPEIEISPGVCFDVSKLNF